MSDASSGNNASFLRVPAEIRLNIYKLLLSDHNDKIVRIRTEDSLIYEGRKREQRRRCKFRYIADRLRSRTAESTYYLVKMPGVDTSIHPSILGANRQIHNEASHVLYSEHTFDFGQDIESIHPFLQDLTPAALSSIKRMNILKRSLPYTKDFDRCEWRNACAFISQNMQLERLDLGVCGGTPSLAGHAAFHWKQRSTYTKEDFRFLSKFDEMEEQMEWVKEIAAIKGLKVLNVKAVLEHCPIPSSKAMAFFVNFSASIEKGFAEYLKSLMVTPA
ncbi:hypothetical protein MMC28_000778 [Mycoblastus sanguinarius]|nr:hypothetical protein [Mycoblastus sanguinarius]